MQIALIQEGVIANLIVAPSGDYIPPEGYVLASVPEHARIGDGWDSETLTPAPLPDPGPEPVPQVISDRQFAQQLAVLGTITWEEAIAWAARGDLPPAMEAAVAALPEEQRNPARMLLSSATTYERSHPLVPMLGATLEYDAAELDDLWRAAAVL